MLKVLFPLLLLLLPFWAKAVLPQLGIGPALLWLLAVAVDRARSLGIPYLRLDFMKGETAFGKSTNYLDVTATDGWYRLRPMQAYSGVQGETSDGTQLPPNPRDQQARQMDNDALAIKEGRAPVAPGEDGLADHAQAVGRRLHALAQGRRRPLQPVGEADVLDELGELLAQQQQQILAVLTEQGATFEPDFLREHLLRKVRGMTERGRSSEYPYAPEYFDHLVYLERTLEELP